MKIKYILYLFLLLFIFSNPSFSKTVTLSNNKISLDIAIEENNNIYLSQISDFKGQTEFIKNPSKEPLWSFTAKKNEDFAGEEIKLSAINASALKKNINKTRATLTWKDVKVGDMKQGFDVTLKITLKEENSYWDFNISKNPEYGIWTVSFPNIAGLDVTKGNEFFYPICGGILDNNFETGSFVQPYPYYGCAMQFCSLTKDNSSLYLCPEDLKCKLKLYSCTTPTPGEMTYNINLIPTNMAVAGKEYKQEYKFNIAVVKGDNYNVCKKYRKWGIDNKFTPFARGPIDQRKDLPQWWKDNCVWFTCNFDMPLDWAYEMLDDLSAPLIVHMYQWSKYVFDSHYPNMLPQKDNVLGDMEEFRKHNAKLMPYTNGRLVDTNQSDYYKKFGDILLGVNEKGEHRSTVYQSAGTNNMESCVWSPYGDCYCKEVCDILKTIDYDVLYVDQLGTVSPMTCFSKEHNHSLGAGENWVAGYNKLLKKVREELNSIKGEGVPITTECSAEAFDVDAYLAFGEWGHALSETSSQMYVYNGYITKFGTIYDESDFTTDNSLPAINKTAVALCKGYQLGWHLRINSYKDPFGTHYKDAVKARMYAKEYFNLGEMVRPVKFVTEIPTKNIYWCFLTEKGEYDFPSVRTCSINYKGKTMICFASVEPEKNITFEWEAKAEDMNLEEKSVYKISEIYPNEKEYSSTEIGGSVLLKPWEIKILVVE